MICVLLGLTAVIMTLPFGPDTSPRPLLAASNTTPSPPRSSATRAGVTVQIVAARQRCNSPLLAPGTCFEEVTLRATNRRRTPYTLYAPEFLLLTATARAAYESAADTALADQIVTSRTVPPHGVLTATVAFVVATHDRLAAVQWSYHHHDPSLTGLDPTAEEVLLLLPGVAHAPVPAGPVGSLTLGHVTVAVRLHAPRRPAGGGPIVWVATVSLHNHSAMPLYYGGGSFDVLDAQGLTHESASLAPALQPLPDSAVLAPGHAVSGRVAALFPAGLKPVAVRWSSLQLGVLPADWVIRLPAALLPAPTPTTTQPPAPQPQVYTVDKLLQEMEQDPQAVVGRTVRVRGVALWSPQTGLLLVDPQVIKSLPPGLSGEQAATWVVAESVMSGPVPYLLLQSLHASRYGKDLTARVYRVDLHPPPCHTNGPCKQGTLLGP